MVVKPSIKINIPNRDDVYLRLYNEKDLREYYNLIDRDRTHLKVFQLWAIDTDYEKTRQNMIENIQGIKQGTRLSYFLVNSPIDKIIGSINIRNINITDASAYMGYWISEEFEGRGIVHDAIATLMDYMSDSKNINRIILEIAPENIRSQNLAKRLGANPTGKFTDGSMPGRPTRTEVWEIKL